MLQLFILILTLLLESGPCCEMAEKNEIIFIYIGAAIYSVIYNAAAVE